MSTTDILAWIGALTGTAALIWDVYKWRTSVPKLSVSVNPNMVSTGDKKSHTLVRVANIGAKKTTITALGFHYVNSRAYWFLRRLLRRSVETWIVAPGPLVTVPHALDVGDEWQAVVPNGSVVDRARARGLLICRIEHALARKPVFVKVNFK